MWGYQVFARKLTWYFIGVYIINIYITYTVPLKIRSTNKSRLFSGSRHSGVKRKIKQSIVKWIEPNCAFTITNFYLPYPLVFFIIIHFCILLFYFFFLPSVFPGTHVRTVRTGSYAPNVTRRYDRFGYDNGCVLERRLCASTLKFPFTLHWTKTIQFNNCFITFSLFALRLYSRIYFWVSSLLKLHLCKFSQPNSTKANINWS